MEDIKAESMRWLESNNIVVLEHLPVIESLDEVTPKTGKAVASRLSALTYLISMGYGAPIVEFRRELEQYHLMEFASENEQLLLSGGKLSKQDKINWQWLTESAQALLWTLKLVDLNIFSPCDDDLISKIPLNEDPTYYIETAELRPLAEIQQQADLLYRLHWYARNCQLEGKKSKVSLSSVLEKRRAIDWVYGVEEEWDDVSLST